ncbi:MAG: ATP-binding protein [Nannocystaceae bacterium]|nr:hypothetical protein [bacterium]
MDEAGEHAALRVRVRHRSDAIAAASMVRTLVQRAGASTCRASVVATVTTELAQNIVSHAGGNGEILAWLDGGDIVVRAHDWGSASPTRSSGMGQGQASVRRMMDRVELQPSPEGGLIVTARTRIGKEPIRSCT